MEESAPMPGALNAVVAGVVKQHHAKSGLLELARKGRM
jgi:hypothetical protein